MKRKAWTKAKRRKATTAVKPTYTPTPAPDIDREPSYGASNCANCDEKFKQKPVNKGFFRHSVENKLPCGKFAKDLLTSVTGVSFANNARAFEKQYLCAGCWQLANKIGHFIDGMSDFCVKSSPSSYIGKRSVSFRRFHAAMPATSEVKEEVEDPSYSASYAVDIGLAIAAVPPKKRKIADTDPSWPKQKKVQACTCM